MKKGTIIEKVKVGDAVAGGKCIVKEEGRAIFVTGVVPDDIIDLKVLRKKKGVLEGIAVNIHEKSAKRTEAFCSHFGICGGCKWQHMSYENQLFYKEKQVRDNLERIGKVDIESIAPILPSKETRYYRNKLEFTFSNQRWLYGDEIKSNDTFNRNGVGFHIPGKFDKIVHVDHCYLQGNISNDIRLFIHDYAQKTDIPYFDLRAQTGILRNLIIRTSSTGEVMVILSVKQKTEAVVALLDALKEKFSDLTSIMVVENDKRNDTISDLDIHLVHGRDHIFEEMEGLKFKIGPKSFYQTNSEQAYALYKVARDFADIQPKDIVYDLYTGTGTIANFVARNAQKVIGVEYIPEAIEDARVNSEINSIGNTAFFAGDLKDVLNDDFVAENGKPQVIITDPPRAGMHKDVVRQMLAIGAEKIVYISCNPATQARDINLLSDVYEVAKTQPVDMFPHTHHVENVCLLVKK